ncbi:hypothetical protein [Actinoplanes auranticolor]|uniref:Uncharacterized protein n=1 Tax=Actinoplanes auranticolor TaxID=47988 RepID=A0A919S4Y9_9ACTN|nr:hypothetical protein [Actinoplanes auranticolor]GIM63851.1 hypothetical protein Aau02nite_06750 [Actinoplanes auranticolor]
MRSYPELSEHELRTRLCAIAAEHQPDRTAMLHRIAEYRVGPPVAERRPGGRAVRLAGSALAVSIILGVGGMARWALADGPEPGVTLAETVAAPRPTPSQETPAALWADGSIDPDSDDADSRSDITVKVREPLRALEVTVRVAPTAGLAGHGGTHDVTGATIETTVVRERNALVYRFRLAAGTLAAGTYVFTARYTYADEDGRDAGDDSYAVTATTAADATELRLRGDFY